MFVLLLLLMLSLLLFGLVIVCFYLIGFHLFEQILKRGGDNCGKAQFFKNYSNTNSNAFN